MLIPWGRLSSASEIWEWPNLDVYGKDQDLLVDEMWDCVKYFRKDKFREHSVTWESELLN